MKRQEITKTLWWFQIKKTFGLHGLYKKYVSALMVKVCLTRPEFNIYGMYIHISALKGLVMKVVIILVYCGDTMWQAVAPYIFTQSCK